MNPTKARYLGTVYTFLFSILHILILGYVLVFLFNTDVFRFRYSEEVLTSLDRGIPIAFLVSFWLGRRLGIKVWIENKPKFEAAYGTTLNAVTLILTLTMFTIGIEQVIFDGGDHLDDLISLILGTLIAVYFGNMIPMILTAFVMSYSFKIYKS